MWGQFTSCLACVERETVHTRTRKSRLRRTMSDRAIAMALALSAAGMALLSPVTAFSHADWPDGPDPSRKLDPKSLYCCGPPTS